MHDHRLLVAVLLVFLSGKSVAEADGPDHFRASAIEPGNILNIHRNPDTKATITGVIPVDGTCIRNLGCQGGLTLNEFTTLSPTEQAQRLQEYPRWCKISYQGINGWVNGHHLAEQHCDQHTALDENSLPAFDCRRANGTVEELVCRDPSLAQLDRQLNGVYSAALQRYRIDNYEDPRAQQRGWIKGRNDCWKADDVRQCALSAYHHRIAELQVHYGQLEAPSPVYFNCEASALTAVFYPQTIPPAVVLTITPAIQDVSQVLAYQQPSGSGAKYQGRNVSFREHQGEARLNWSDKQLNCKVVD